MTGLSVDVELLMETANVLNRTGRDLVSCCNSDCCSIINELDRIALKYRDYSSVTSRVRDIKADINEILRSSRELEERNQNLVTGLKNAARTYKEGEQEAKAVISQDKINVGGKVRSTIRDNMHTPSGNIRITELNIKSEEDAKKYVTELEENTQEIEMYTTILNNYRASGQGEPQWVLDKLEELGAPYGIIEKNVTLSYEGAINAGDIADALLKERYQPNLMEALEAIVKQQSLENWKENILAELTGVGKQIYDEVITNHPVLLAIKDLKECSKEASFAISDWDAYVKSEKEEFINTVAFLNQKFRLIPGTNRIELTPEGKIYAGEIIQAICTEIYHDPKKFNEFLGRAKIVIAESIITGSILKNNSVTSNIDNIDDVDNFKKVSSTLNVDLIDQIIDQGDLISVKLKDGKQFLFNKAEISADELKRLEELKLFKRGSKTINRPSWRQSEIDASKQFPEYAEQKSFIDGKEVPYGTKGSVRPDLYKEGSSIDVKNYNVESATGRSNLARNIEKQYYQRVDNLPEGTEQMVLIDIRGQNVSNADLTSLYNDILKRTNNEIAIKIKTN